MKTRMAALRPIMSRCVCTSQGHESTSGLSTDGWFSLSSLSLITTAFHYSHRGLHIVHKKLSLSFLVLISFPRGITQVLTLIITAFKFLISSPRFSSYHHLYAFTLWIHHPYLFFCLYPLSISVIPRSIVITTLLHPSSSWPLTLHLGSDQHYRDSKPSAYLQPHLWPLSCSHKWLPLFPPLLYWILFTLTYSVTFLLKLSNSSPFPKHH